MCPELYPVKKERSVQIIIVNHNGRDYLEDCLSNLEQQDYPRDCLDILVVDNASVDGSVEFIQSRFPGVKVIRNWENLGFAAGIGERSLRLTDIFVDQETGQNSLPAEGQNKEKERSRTGR